MTDTRLQILFGHHETQMPAICAAIDHERYRVYFAPFEAVDVVGMDLVVPLRLEQFPAARAALARAGEGPRGVLPSAECVALIDDKLAFARWLVANGFGDVVPPLLPEPPSRYPYVRKARHGTFGQGIRIVRAPGDAGDAPEPGTFAQALVEGAHEWVLHLLRIGGTIRYRLCYRYDMGKPASIRGQADVPVEIVPDDPGPAYDTCVAILAALGFEGVCCFNYKLLDGKLQVIELNPRFGGSLASDVTRFVEAYLAAL